MTVEQLRVPQLAQPFRPFKISMGEGRALLMNSLGAVSSVNDSWLSSIAMPDHTLLDQRSLAFGLAIASPLDAHPDLIHRAQKTLERWLATCSPRSRGTLDDWQLILSGPAADIKAVLSGTDERSTRLRQSNPFAGVLPQRQRNAIIRQFYGTRSA